MVTENVRFDTRATYKLACPGRATMFASWIYHMVGADLPNQEGAYRVVPVGCYNCCIVLWELLNVLSSNFVAGAE